MRKIVVPIAVYVVIALISILLIDTVFRVYLQQLTCLAVALLIPTIWAVRVSSISARALICLGCAVGAILLYDATIFLISSKPEPFDIIRYHGWIYGPGAIAFSSLSFCVAWFASPLRRGISD